MENGILRTTLGWKKEHRSHNRELERNYYKRNHDNIRERHRMHNRDLKMLIFHLLGDKCMECGYIGLALQIDHVNGGGTKERRRGTSLHSNNYTYFKTVLLKILNGSKDYQLLCANCNYIKRLLIEGSRRVD